jgi:hypothetical protein
MKLEEEELEQLSESIKKEVPNSENSISLIKEYEQKQAFLFFAKSIIFIEIKNAVGTNTKIPFMRVQESQFISDVVLNYYKEKFRIDDS